jgi:hypothetical protein
MTHGADIDFRVANLGSIWAFTPVSERAREFSKVTFADSMKFIESDIVAHRYARGIVQDLRATYGFNMVDDDVT